VDKNPKGYDKLLVPIHPPQLPNCSDYHNYPD
jgi:hypothetical protein